MEMICENAAKCGADGCYHHSKHGDMCACEIRCGRDDGIKGSRCIPYVEKLHATCANYGVHSENEPCKSCMKTDHLYWKPIIKDTPKYFYPRTLFDNPFYQRYLGVDFGLLMPSFTYFGDWNVYKPQTKDTTMTVSYNQLKELGPKNCAEFEKGLIWFYTNLSFGNMDAKIELVGLLKSICDQRIIIRDIYHCDPDKWIKWLEENVKEKPRINLATTFSIFRDTYSGQLAIPAQVGVNLFLMLGYAHNGINRFSDEQFDINNIPEKFELVKTFPDFKSFAEYLYKETHK